MMDSLLDRHLDGMGLSRVLVGDDEHAHDAEYRLITSASSVVFQGTLDRCSDFVRGYIYAKTGQRQVW